MTTSNGYRYLLVDVFTDQALHGNPLAVFPDASGLDEHAMQAIARELNLSETTFVFPSEKPECSARVRIFTPGKEMDFAGHPTLGTAAVLKKEGVFPEGVQQVLLEEKVGPVPVLLESGPGPRFWLQTPPIQEGLKPYPDLCARALSLKPDDLLRTPPQYLSAGNPTVFVAVHDPQTVDRAILDSAAWETLRDTLPGPCCLYVFALTGGGTYSRMFAPDYGVAEDPATGSSAGPLARYMMINGLLADTPETGFLIEQGVKMGRRSLLHVRIKPGKNGKIEMLVGGNVVPVAEGTLHPGGIMPEQSP